MSPNSVLIIQEPVTQSNPFPIIGPPTPADNIEPPFAVCHFVTLCTSSRSFVVSDGLVLNSSRTTRPQSTAPDPPYAHIMTCLSGQFSRNHIGIHLDINHDLPRRAGKFTMRRNPPWRMPTAIFLPIQAK